ncbi:MAG: molybdenum cofactor guanylyltransferase [Bacteroidales bacterium]|nr:molybdenum cofactor guanylyltransferase [Bacteroidales bacterium]
MTHKVNHITGILLAGGKSTRMGTDKGTIDTGDKKLFQYPLKLLEATCDEILISTCRTSQDYKHYEQVCDEIYGIGPLGGIYTCLKRSASDINIVLSYDMPMLTQSLIIDLLGYSDAYELVLPALEKKDPEPLCGIYNKSLTGSIEKIISGGAYAVHKLIPMVKTRILTITASKDYFHPDLFMNVNSPADLEYYFKVKDRLQP